MASSFEKTIYQNRTADLTFTLYQEDGTTGVAIAATDVVRFKLARGDGATPIIDADSVAASANGSVVTLATLTAPAVVDVRLAQEDLEAADLMPGAYRAEVVLVDDSETAPADAAKHVQSGIIHVVGTLGGDIGKT